MFYREIQMKDPHIYKEPFQVYLEWFSLAHIFILNTIGTEVLNLARGHQEGRVPENGTTVPSVGLGIPG